MGILLILYFATRSTMARDNHLRTANWVRTLAVESEYA
jgi:hypothetical protein